jgi:hypothetical protein
MEQGLTSNFVARSLRGYRIRHEDTRTNFETEFKTTICQRRKNI